MRRTIFLILLLGIVGCNVNDRQKETAENKKAKEISKKNGEKEKDVAALQDIGFLKDVDVTTLQVGLGVGDLAPNTQGEDGEGVAFSLEDYRGKVIMLDFWGDW